MDLRIHNLRDWTTDRHRTVDDYPYGGGAGMVLKPEPLFAAIESLRGAVAGRGGGRDGAGARAGRTSSC